MSLLDIEQTHSNFQGSTMESQHHHTAQQLKIKRRWKILLSPHANQLSILVNNFWETADIFNDMNIQQCERMIKLYDANYDSIQKAYNYCIFQIGQNWQKQIYKELIQDLVYIYDNLRLIDQQKLILKNKIQSIRRQNINNPYKNAPLQNKFRIKNIKIIKSQINEINFKNRNQQSSFLEAEEPILNRNSNTCSIPHSKGRNHEINEKIPQEQDWPPQTKYNQSYTKQRRQQLKSIQLSPIQIAEATSTLKKSINQFLIKTGLND